MKIDLSNPFKTLFFLWAAACIVILPLLSMHAGITEDEPQHITYGRHVLDWYRGVDSTAVMSPFDNGVWKLATEGATSKTAINIYGGFVDGTSELIYRTITHHFFDPYESKHIISSIYGVLLFIIIGLICLTITDSWGIALLGLVIATFTPRLFGYALSNPKDIPFATMFMFCMWQIISTFKELPNLSIKRMILLGLSFSMAMGIRSGGAILIFYFQAFLFPYLLYLWYTNEIDFNRALKIFVIAGVVSVIGYLGCALFWPWDTLNPILNPWRSLSVFKSLNEFNCSEVFEGEWIGNGQRPWYWQPKWIYITLPLTTIFGCALFLILIPKFLKKSKSEILAYGLLMFSFLFPMLSIIISDSNVLNAERHVLFAVPGLIILATLAWAELFKQVKDSYQRMALGILFLMLIGEPARFIACNNPVQSMYFSPVVGGVKGAFKNYEMDYYGYSIRPAVDWIAEHDSIHAPGRKARVRMWYGEQIKLTHYIDSSQTLAYALCEENSQDWDYSIVLPSESKFNHDLLLHWPPAGTIYQVKADQTPLCAIVKNPRITYVQSNSPSQATVTYTTPAPADPFAALLAEGVGYYQKADYNKAVIIFKKCVELKPKDTIAINDVVASYNSLKMFDEAIEYAKKGFAIAPNFQLLKNNVAESYKAKKNFVPNEAYYHNLSYNYYVQQDYLKTIETAKKALKLNPNSSIAWNNICSAYNQLKEYQKAMDACDRGLKIDAQNAMLKNNRAEAARLAGQK